MELRDRLPLWFRLVSSASAATVIPFFDGSGGFGKANPKLEKSFASEKELTRIYGPDQAKVLALRISQLRAARCLADLLLIQPLRAHELGADRKGQISLNLRQPYRLILIPAHIPPPLKPDGGLDWRNVTEVTITEVVDYH